MDLLFLFILGAIIGSFINCFIWRARHGGSVWRGRSRCVHCHAVISAGDNVPLVSFLLLRGRCRNCQDKIPTHYFFTELFTGFLFALAGFFHTRFSGGGYAMLAGELFFLALLVIIFVYDWLYQIIMPGVVWLGAVAGIIFNLVFHAPSLTVFWGHWFLAVAVGAGFFLLQYLISRGRWIGGGDVRFGVMLGSWLLWPNVVIMLLLAYIIGALVSLVLICRDRANWRRPLPFGVFLSIAAFITLYFGEIIGQWYQHLLYG